MRRSLVLALLVSLAFLPGSAGANGIVIPDVELVAGPMGSATTFTAAQLEANSTSVVENVDGSISFLDGSMSTAMWGLTWDDITVKEDPFVSFTAGFTNFAGIPMNFVFNITTPILPVLPSSLIGGSTAVTYLDANNDGAGGLFNNGLGYSGEIDLVNALTMLTPLSLTPLFPGDVKVTSQVLGLPGPTIPGPPALATIGITHNFNLSSLDQATFNSFFIVEPVPEPATLRLTALGLAALAFFRVQRARA